ncbi:hypothetical protein SCOCK_100185 [Actinacidiphila cocklensis]|uniref:Uncharacterized protein n=1 Tax=Actinacidiphila cocklensis TaxID=887465 RepID=A0A9W4DJ09_9ACTN|nr:hypothetical protein SCOCK_100185 [Actinacidiphila cocklensis]
MERTVCVSRHAGAEPADGSARSGQLVRVRPEKRRPRRQRGRLLGIPFASGPGGCSEVSDGANTAP